VGSTVSRRSDAAALLGYVAVALAFAWPLPLHLGSAALGPVGSDAGVYIWNLWVFRHELVAHHSLPFSTHEILSLRPAVSLALHNYTTVANIFAFPLLPILGTVATYNVVVISSSVASAYAMFLLARRSVRDDGAAWLAGLVFAFCPFMSARSTMHLSLLQAAPLPVFALVLNQWRLQLDWKTAATAGAVVAWAFLSDPYYAVYCQLMAVFAVACATLAVKRTAVAPKSVLLRFVLDLALVCLGGLIAGIMLRGGGRFDMLGLRVSVTRLYTPVLLFTAAAVARVWIAARPRISWTLPAIAPQFRMVAISGVACLTMLSPVLLANRSQWGEPTWISPTVYWRSSAPGQDFLSFLAPNPLHPWFGALFRDAIARMPNGFVENVASVPWVLIAVIVGAVWYARARLPGYWMAFTATFGLLALGPFVRIAGVNTYVPTPWVFLRYLPIVGAARMPTRLALLMMLGASMLLAYAVRDLRARWRHPIAATAAIGGMLIFELLPAPRILHSAAVPSVYRIIRDDPRPVRVLNLPFGLRDGLSSHGNNLAVWQYFQTFHEKQLLGGYISRLPRTGVDYYNRRRVTSVLMWLSAGVPVPADTIRTAIARAHETRDELNIGYVVVDVGLTPPELVAFAVEAFDLTGVAQDGNFVLYRTPLAPPLPVGSMPPA
jgi:hypothetical protein